MSLHTGQPPSAGGDDGTIVRTGCGALRGQLLAGGVIAFRGIRYAEAPLGDLRWKPPVPATPWTGVRSALEFGAACVQVGTVPEPKTSPGTSVTPREA